jgi:hypothetical protein
MSVNTSQLNPHNLIPWRLRVLDSWLLEFSPSGKLLWSGLVWSGLVWSGLVWSGLTSLPSFGRTESRSPPLSVPVCVFCVVLDTMCNTVVTKSAARQWTCIRWQRNIRNVFSQPLPNNDHLFWLYYSGFQASCQNMPLLQEEMRL